jgi:glycosyltransferase involved in cell wall biosynthesis
VKIAHVLPELDEGGVERIVPVMANLQANMGHGVMIVSRGGRMESLLSPRVRLVKLPVHSKNPFEALYCASRLASLARREGVNALHAHSRVPGWVCLTARGLAGNAKFVYTAHAKYSSLNMGVWPLRRADGVICVSESVKNYLSAWLPRDPARSRVIYNSLPGVVVPWEGGSKSGAKRLLFAGRLSAKKGPMILLEALAALEAGGRVNWTLDVLGDGPLSQELRARAAALGLGDKIFLRGFSASVPEHIAKCDLFLCPSFEEGFGLSLAEALSAGAPVLASDIDATRELTASSNGLLPAGDVKAWAAAIARFLDGEGAPPLSLAVDIPSAGEMARLTAEFYESVV